MAHTQTCQRRVRIHCNPPLDVGHHNAMQLKVTSRVAKCDGHCQNPTTHESPNTMWNKTVYEMQLVRGSSSCQVKTDSSVEAGFSGDNEFRDAGNLFKRTTSAQGIIVHVQELDITPHAQLGIK